MMATAKILIFFFVCFVGIIIIVVVVVFFGWRWWWRQRLFCELLLLLLLLLWKLLKAFPVDNSWTRLIVLLFRDPHLLEGGQRGQDGPTDPDGVFTLRWSNDLDLDGGWSQGGDFLLHSVSNTWVHGGTSGQYSVGVQVLSDIDVALHDGVVHGLMDTARFHSQEGRLEEGLRAPETFITDGDDLSIGQFVGLLEGGGSRGGGHFLLKVKSNIAQFLLDVSDNFSLSSGGE